MTGIWREIERSLTAGTWHVVFRCGNCRRLAVTGGHNPTKCVCGAQS